MPSIDFDVITGPAAAPRRTQEQPKSPSPRKPRYSSTVKTLLADQLRFAILVLVFKELRRGWPVVR